MLPVPGMKEGQIHLWPSARMCSFSNVCVSESLEQGGCRALFLLLVDCNNGQVQFEAMANQMTHS